MKPFLFILLLLIADSVFAKTVVIGNGRGSVYKENMQGLVPGDILAITPGIYKEAIFSNLHGITVINHGGPVVFTGYITLSRDSALVFSGDGKNSLQYGFSFSGGGFRIIRRCVGLRIYRFEAVNSDRLVDVSENRVTMVYTGDSSTILLRYITMANIRMIHCGSIFCGSFATPHDLHNVVDSLAIFNVTCDSTSTNGPVVFGAGIYRFDFHNMTIHEPQVNSGGDMGVFSIFGGYGQVHNVYRNGGWGWLCRIFGASIGNTIGDVWIYNNIDLNSTCYGTAEVRCEAAQWINTNLLTGINIHIINNTSGNKIDPLHYTTAIALIPTIETGYHSEIKNNLAFNNQNPGKNGTCFEYWNLSNPPDTANNLYFRNYFDAGLADDLTCYLKTGSPAIDAGVSIDHIASDIDNIKRPQGKAFDVGAREYVFSKEDEINNSRLSFMNKIYILSALLLILLVAGFFMLRKSTRKKKVRFN